MNYKEAKIVKDLAAPAYEVLKRLDIGNCPQCGISGNVPSGLKNEDGIEYIVKCGTCKGAREGGVHD